MPKKSTIVPNMLRTTLGTLEHVNPDWSAFVAERLWFRAGDPPAADRRNRHVLERGTLFTLPVKTFSSPAAASRGRMPRGSAAQGFSAQGSEVRGVSFGDPAGPLAYLLHGWGGWWQQLSSFVPALTAHGYRVIAFDALAHGDSGPGSIGRRSTTVPEMAESYHAIAELFGPPELTVAHSMGVLSVVWAQHHHGILPARQVLVAPAASTRVMLEFFGGAIGIGEPTLQRLASRFAARMGRPLSDFDLLPLVAAEQNAGRLPPALIVHDKDDRMTSPVESERLAAAWPGSELLLTEGHGHYRVLRAPEALERVGDFATPRKPDVELAPTP